jgi:hypothetical protein
MIVNFEEITYELDPYEYETLLPLVIAGLRTKKGSKMAANSTYICKTLKGRGLDINDSRLRKIIHYIRTYSLIEGLVATSKGYYISTEVAELEKYVLSLRQRETSIREARLSIETYINKIKGNHEN